MDLHMPRQGGVAATREITQALPATQVLVLTTLDDDETVFAAVRAGAQGYLLKDATEQELLETIRALMRGESRLTPQIARKVMDQFRELATEADRASPTGSPTEARRGCQTRRSDRSPERKRRQDSSAHHRRHEQPTNCRGDVPRGRPRSRTYVSRHHGQAARQHTDCSGGDLRAAAATLKPRRRGDPAKSSHPPGRPRHWLHVRPRA